MAGGDCWLRSSLVVAQVALSLVLVIAAGQFLRTLINLRRVDFGLRTSNAIVFTVNPSLNGYDKTRSRELYRALLSGCERRLASTRSAPRRFACSTTTGGEVW